MNNENYEINLDQGLIDYASHGAEVKDQITQTSAMRFLMRAAVAGVLLAFFYMVYFSVDALFEEIGTEAVNLANIGAFLSAWIFAFALIFIYYTKSELLTSNMMAMTMGKLTNKVTWKGFWVVLILTYVGNVLGGLFVGILLSGSTIISPDMAHVMQSSIDTKLSYVNAGFSGYTDLLVRAIWCNFFINLSMMSIYSGMVKSDFGKIVVIFGGIFVFMRLGFEHSVANSALFVAAWVTGAASAPVGAVLPSILIALIGNFIGGGLLIGAYYYIMNNKK